MQRKCPNCGHDVEMPPVANPTGDYCPDCGALLTEFNPKSSSWKACLFSGVLVLILLGSLCVGFLGACLAIFSGFPGDLQSSGGLVSGLLILAGAVVVGGLCFRALIKPK